VTLTAVTAGSFLVAFTMGIDVGASPPPNPGTVTDDKADTWVRLSLCTGLMSTVRNWATIHYCASAVGGTTVITFNSNTNTDYIVAAEFSITTALSFLGQSIRPNSTNEPIQYQLAGIDCPLPTLLATCLASNGGGQTMPRDWRQLQNIGAAPNFICGFRIVSNGDDQAPQWGTLGGTGALNLAAWSEGAPSFLALQPLGRGRS
jgi:hypothetical protein